MGRSPYNTVAALVFWGLAGVGSSLAGPIADSRNPSWTGPFLGMDFGKTAAKITYTELPIPGLTDKVVYQFADQRNVYSLHAGYDQEVGDRYVLGVELSGDWLGYNIAPLGSGGFGSLFSSSYEVMASSRVGVLTDPKTLVYVRGGAGLVSVDAATSFTTTKHELLPAAVFGVGVETMIAGNISARLEAGYTLPIRPLSSPGDHVEFDPHYLKITGGLTWRLDADNTSSRTVAALDSDLEAFQGGYAGINLGYDLGQMKRPVATAGATVGPFASEGAGGGAQVGFDVRLDRVVAGVEADVKVLDAKFYDPAQNSPQQGSTKLFGSIDGTAMLSGRLGMLTDAHTLVYLKGGMGVLQTTANPKFFTFGSGGTKYLIGHEVGVGVETMITDQLSLGVEGLYTMADQGYTVDLTQTDQATLFPSTLSATAKLNWHY